MRRVALVVLVACGGAARPPASDIAVAPVAASASATPPPPEEPQTRFDMGFDDARQICVRVESRVRCANALEALAGALPVAEDAVDLAVGHDVACIVRRGGNVSCWGANDSGQLGAGLAADDSGTPVDVRGVAHARRVAVGAHHGCATLEDGDVACWGDNRSGETGGDAVYTAAVRELVEARRVGVRASAIAVGRAGSYALGRGGEVVVWGYSELDGVVDERLRTIAAFSGADAIAAHAGVLCELRLGALACAGDSMSLFGDFRGRTAAPIAIRVHGKVRRVRIAERHGCALRTDGRVECWGSNAEGVLGRRDASDPSATYAPAVVEDLPHAIDVFVGDSLSCALTDARDLYCWGSISAAPVPVRL